VSEQIDDSAIEKALKFSLELRIVMHLFSSSTVLAVVLAVLVGQFAIQVIGAYNMIKYAVLGDIYPAKPVVLERNTRLGIININEPLHVIGNALTSDFPAHLTSRDHKPCMEEVYFVL
jgi:hypothetical protein